jgi:hypothetical protein
MKKCIALAILIICSLNSTCQPGTKVKELLRDRYTVQGGRYGHPYTTFDNTKGKTFEEIVNQIRKRIKDEKPNSDDKRPIFLAYKLVYDNALSPRPTDDGMPNTGISGLARWAKSNAFVMLVGLNGNGDSLSLAGRDSCKSRVLKAFWEELCNFIITL